MGIAVSALTTVWAVLAFTRVVDASAVLWGPLAVLSLALWAPPWAWRPAEHGLRVGWLLLLAAPTAVAGGFPDSVGMRESWGVVIGMAVGMLLGTTGLVVLVVSWLFLRRSLGDGEPSRPADPPLGWP